MTVDERSVVLRRSAQVGHEATNELSEAFDVRQHGANLVFKQPKT